MNQQKPSYLIINMLTIICEKNNFNKLHVFFSFCCIFKDSYVIYHFDVSSSWTQNKHDLRRSGQDSIGQSGLAANVEKHADPCWQNDWTLHFS